MINFRKKTTIKQALTLLFTPLFLLSCTNNSIPISILDLSCDSKCENLYITISTPDGDAITTVFNIKNKAWTQLVSAEGVRFSYLSGYTSDDLVASNENEILSVNFKDRSYRILYKHTAHVFYPMKIEDRLYFSESTIQAHGTKNPNQNRILWKLDMTRNVLLQGLRPWTAYQIGRPFIVNNEWLYIDFILPSKQSDGKYTESDLNGTLKDQSAYKLNLKTVFSIQQVSQESLLNGRLLFGGQKVEQISIDKNGQYIGFYSLSSTPSHWEVYDTRSDESIVSIVSNGNDRLVVSPDGSAYAYVAEHTGYLNVSIGMLPNKKTLLDLSLSTKEIKQTIFERKEK